MSFFNRFSKRWNYLHQNETFLYHQSFADLKKGENEGEAGKGHHVQLIRRKRGECIWRCHRVRDVGTMTDDVVPTTIRQNGFLIQNNQGSPVPLYFVGYIAGKPVFKVYNVDINVVPKAS